MKSCRSHLAGHFCDQARRKLGLGPIRLHPDAVNCLENYTWPGNVRELENTLSRAVLRASGRVSRGNLILVQPADLGGDFYPEERDRRSAEQHEAQLQQAMEVVDEDSQPRPLREAVEDYQRRLIREALARHDGVWAAAARELGMHRSNLHHLSVRLGLREAGGNSGRSS